MVLAGVQRDMGKVGGYGGRVMIVVCVCGKQNAQTLCRGCRGTPFRADQSSYTVCRVIGTAIRTSVLTFRLFDRCPLPSSQSKQAVL